MNKMICGIVIAVCVLGMALIMLSERLNGNKTTFTTEERLNQHITVTTPLKMQQDTQDKAIAEVVEQPAVSQNLYSVRAPVQHQIISEDTLVAEERLKTESPVAEQNIKVEKKEPNIHPIAKTSADMSMLKKDKVVAEDNPKTHAQAKQPVEQADTPKKETVKAKKEPIVKQVAKATPPQKNNVKEKEKEKEKEKAALKEQQTIKKFVVFNRENGATVRLQGSSPLKYKTTNMHNPERILVELDGKWQVIAPGVPKNPLVTNVRIGKYPSKTHIVVDLRSKPKLSRVILGKDRQTVDIRVDL